MEQAIVGIILLGAAGGLSWIGWMTKKIIEIASNTASTNTTLDDHEERLSELERLFPRHVVAD